jgi:hypothetical protein
MRKTSPVLVVTTMLLPIASMVSMLSTFLKCKPIKSTVNKRKNGKTNCPESRLASFQTTYFLPTEILHRTQNINNVNTNLQANLLLHSLHLLTEASTDKSNS